MKCSVIDDREFTIERIKGDRYVETKKIQREKFSVIQRF